MGAWESASAAAALGKGAWCVRVSPPCRVGRPKVLSSPQAFNAYPLDNGGALCIMVV